MMAQPLTHQQYLLKRFPGKGGWTYAELPEIPMDPSAPFGWVRVKGRIDDYHFGNYHLMPMGNGKLFLPVKAAVRKKIGKQAGDLVTVELYLDDAPVAVPAELSDCLDLEPAARQYFLSLPPSGRKQYIDWIYAAKKTGTRVERIARCIELLLQQKTYSSMLKRENR